jgi:hypothetical protein
VRFSFAGPRVSHSCDRCTLSSSFAFLQSVAQRNLVCRPRPADSSHGLLLPSAHQGPAIHLPRALPQPATFRLQGLATLLTVYSRRARAGFVSHRRRSWDSPFGAFPSRKVSATFPGGRTHVPFIPSLFPPPRRRVGPTGRGFWALPLSRVPGDLAGVNSPVTGCSHGLRPLRVFQRKSCPGFRPGSTHTLSETGPGDRSRRRPGVSIGFRLVPSTPPGKPDDPDGTTLPGFSHQHDPAHSGKPASGLWVHLIPRRALLPTDR